MTRRLRIGIQLPEVERVVRWAEYLDLARAAEAVGFDSIWLGDHLLYRDHRGERGPWEVWTMLGALAGATSRVTLGPLVACTAFHPPAVLAKMAATVDEVSGGRLVLGLGAGWNEPDFRDFGLPFDRRVSRFAEALSTIVPLVRGDRVGDAVLLPTSARQGTTMPVMVGSVGQRMLEVALPHVDGWNTWFADFGNTVERFAAMNRRVSDIAVQVGRDPASIERSVCLLVVVDPASTEREVPAGCPALSGHPDELAEALRTYAAAGADEVILVASPIDRGSIERLGDTVALIAADPPIVPR